MITVGEIIAKLQADISGWQRGFAEAEKTSKRFSDSFKRIVEVGLGVSIANFGVQAVAQLRDVVKEISKLGLEAKVQEGAFERLASAAGVSSDRLVKSMQAASGEILNVSDAMTAASRALTQGFSDKQIVEIMAASRQLAKIAGVDVVRAFNDVTVALTTGMTRSLKTSYGIVIDADQAVKDYATSNARLAEDITEAGRAQALYNAFVAKTTPLVKSLKDETRSESEEVQRLQANVEQLKEDFGKMIPHGEIAAAANRVLDAVTALRTGLLDVARPYVISISVAWDFGTGAFSSVVKAIEDVMDKVETELRKTPLGRRVWDAIIGSKESVAAAKATNVTKGMGVTSEVLREGASPATGLATSVNALRGDFFRTDEAQPLFEEALSMSEILREAAIAAEAFARAGAHVETNWIESEVLIDAESQARGLQDRLEELKAEGAALMELPVQALPTGFEERAAKTMAAVEDLREELKKSGLEAKALGDSAQTLAKRDIDILDRALRDLVRQGVDPASESVASLRAELDRLKNQEKLRDTLTDVFNSVTDAIDKAVEGVIQGTQSMKDAFKKLGDYILLDFAKTVLKKALDPIKDALVEIGLGLLSPTTGSFTSLFTGTAATVGGAAVTGLATGTGTGFSAGTGGPDSGVGTGSTLGSVTTTLQMGSNLLGGKGLLEGISNIPTNWASSGVSGVLLGSAGTTETLGLLSGGIAAETAGTSGLLGAGGALSATTGALAGVGIALNLATALSDLGSSASTGNLAGTVAGGVIGGVAAGPVGALVGAAIGGAAGGFLGGLFGGKPKKSHEQRETEELDRTIGKAKDMETELGDVTTVTGLFDVLKKWNTGYVGGTSDQAISTYFDLSLERFNELLDKKLVSLPTGFTDIETYAKEKGFLDLETPWVPAFVGDVNTSYPTVQAKGLGSLLKTDRESFVVSTQAGVTQSKLTAINVAIDKDIEDLQAGFDELTRDWNKEINDLFKESLAPLTSKTLSAQEELDAATDAFKDFLAEYRTAADEALDIERLALLDATDEQAILDQTKLIKDAIKDRYEFENDLIDAFVADLDLLKTDWQEVVDDMAVAIEDVRTDTSLGVTNPSERLDVARERFYEALDLFREEPTPEGATAVKDLVTPYLEAAADVYTRPSMDYQDILTETLDALTEIKDEAQAQIDLIDTAIVDALGENTDVAQLTADNTAAMNDLLADLRVDALAALDRLLGGDSPLSDSLQKLVDAAEGKKTTTTTTTTTSKTVTTTPTTTTEIVTTTLNTATGLITDEQGNIYGILPTLQHGTERVPETRPYLLHAGEMVLNPSAAERARSGENSIAVSIGDIHVTGADDPRATADAVIDALERRLRNPGRLREAVRSVAKGGT